MFKTGAQRSNIALQIGNGYTDRDKLLKIVLIIFFIPNTLSVNALCCNKVSPSFSSSVCKWADSYGKVNNLLLLI